MAYLAGSGSLKTYARTCFGILFVAEGPIDYKLTEVIANVVPWSDLG